VAVTTKCVIKANIDRCEAAVVQRVWGKWCGERDALQMVDHACRATSRGNKQSVLAATRPALIQRQPRQRQRDTTVTMPPRDIRFVTAFHVQTTVSRYRTCLFVPHDRRTTHPPFTISHHEIIAASVPPARVCCPRCARRFTGLPSPDRSRHRTTESAQHSPAARYQPTVWGNDEVCPWG